MTERVLRGFAIAIAITAAIDPAITTARRIRPEIAVVPADSARDAALADRVSRLLDDDFRVLRALFAGAAATIVAGDALPAVARHSGGLAFAVMPESRARDFAFESVRVPAISPLNGAVTVEAALRVRGGDPVDVVLEAGGIAVDRATAAADGTSAQRDVRLTFVPAAEGALPLRLKAKIGDEVLATADAVVTVSPERWSVLFFDTRPSWTSTFVRRALERDARFDVAFRVITSRAASLAGGRAPQSLADASGLARFDAIVVGAPDGLAQADVAALEAYMRRRGGAVVLLLDGDAAGPYERLTRVAAWSGVTGVDAVAVPEVDGGDTLRAGALRFPRALPAGASAIAHDPDGNAIVWESPVGPGRLVVSGALDAWRRRDPAASDFDAFWRARIGTAAAASPAAISARIARPVVRPGEETELSIALRDAVFAEASPGATLRVDVSATLRGANVMRRLRVLPESAPGMLRARVRAPDAPGLYHVRVASGGVEAEVPLVVATDAAHVRPDQTELLEVWTTSRGGATMAAADASGLPAMLARALPDVRRSETWHPMRSPWWIAPFALLLGAEWWLRRRRGRA